MLETVDFSEEPLPKEEYKARRDALTERLVVLQQEARAAGVGLVVLFEGWNGAGKGSRISDLMYNLDARATSVYVTENFNAVDAASFPGARARRGRLLSHDAAVLEGARRPWHHHLLRSRLVHRGRAAHALHPVRRGEDQKRQGPPSPRHRRSAPCARPPRSATSMRCAGALASSADFEKQLTDDGYVVVKFFVHVTKEAQRKRLTRLRRDPATALARVRRQDGHHRRTTRRRTACTTTCSRAATSRTRRGT